jgi:hypothetical protein
MTAKTKGAKTKKEQGQKSKDKKDALRGDRP